MLKELIKNDLKLTFDTYGAYTREFTKGDTSIFFPFKEMEVDGQHKLRGGNHVCAPNFGPDEKYYALKQHGFARESEWDVVNQNENSIEVKLEGIEDFENVEFVIVHILEEDKLFTELRITNNSDEYRFVAPAFHPYFYAKGNKVEVEGVEVTEEELPKPIFDEARSQKFTTADLDIEVVGLENVNKFVIWTDFGDDYVCVEPSYNGMSFKDEGVEPYKLAPGETFTQKFDIIIK